MNFCLEMICVGGDGTNQRQEVLTVAREHLAMETLALMLAEGKALVSTVQTYGVEEQAKPYLEQHRLCGTCGTPHRGKEPRRRTVNTVFGAVVVPNPRGSCCACHKSGSLTFRPTMQWLTGHTSPELLYLETK